uniref:Fibronectin type-III domain-containing protein n=1 Tax=Amphimedon queenslandica TaxID=400682 RepID=A0A1X7TJQ0_AMPQE
MPASVTLNGSIIECFAFNGSTVNASTQLLVQGLLSEVIDSTVTQINSTTLSLHYTAPFTLIGVPILHYNILISLANISVNITDTQYNIHINNYCIGYDISITPWNIVGMGNTTTLSDIILYQAPVVAMMPQLIQEYKTNIEKLQVYIDFKYNASCKGEVPRLALLKINEEKEEHYFTWESNDGNVNVTINITSLLEYGVTYNVSMSLITANNTETNDFTFNIIDSTVAISLPLFTSSVTSTISIFMSSSGSQVLIVTLSCAGVITIIVITILVIIIAGMYITMKRKKKKNKNGDITSQKGGHMMFNEAYGKSGEGLQVNVAYETVRANAAYNVPNIAPIYDTIPDTK